MALKGKITELYLARSLGFCLNHDFHDLTMGTIVAVSVVFSDGKDICLQCSQTIERQFG
jgi:hypothetical protein